MNNSDELQFRGYEILRNELRAQREQFVGLKEVVGYIENKLRKLTIETNDILKEAEERALIQAEEIVALQKGHFMLEACHEKSCSNHPLYYADEYIEQTPKVNEKDF